MGVIKDMWTRIERGEKVFEPSRLPGKLPRGTKWVQAPEGWTLARKTPEELQQEKARSAGKSPSADSRGDLKRLYLTKANYSLLEAEELLHIQRWIHEIMDQKKDEKRKTLAEKIALMQRELSNLK